MPVFKPLFNPFYVFLTKVPKSRKLTIQGQTIQGLFLNKKSYIISHADHPRAALEWFFGWFFSLKVLLQF